MSLPTGTSLTKPITAIAADGGHLFVLCSDGTLWQIVQPLSAVNKKYTTWTQIA